MTASGIVNNINMFCPGLQADMVYSILNESYAQLCRMEWNALKVTRTLTTQAPYGMGNIDIDALGNITGYGTTFAAWMQGCWLRTVDSNTFFRILTYTSPTVLVLEDWLGIAYTTQAYTITKSVYSFAEPFTVFDVTYNVNLAKKSQSYFNSIDPSRQVTGQPLFWADAGVDPTTLYPMIELFPQPDTYYPLKLYGKLSASILITSSIPILPPELLESHALRQCYRLKDRLDPGKGWDAKAKDELNHYNEIFTICRQEDYERASTPDRVKDIYDVPLFPLDDTFRAAHDVD